MIVLVGLLVGLYGVMANPRIRRRKDIVCRVTDK